VTVADAWSYETGLEALLQAERIMASLLPDEPCGLGVVLGLDGASIGACLREEPDVARVNRNTEECFVLAGPRVALSRALARAEERGAMSGKLLPVGIPYHHPRLLADARGLFARWLSRVSLKAPKIPVISSLNGELLHTAEGIAQYAAGNLSSPLDWLQSLYTMERIQISLVVECGLGLSLSQNARFAPLKAEHGNCRNYARFSRP
jgi:[acyl-carrier-protein] S-malonyltransferase